MKEYVQKNFTVENLLLEARRILTDEHYKNGITENLSRIWDTLGNEDASKNAAGIICSYINN